LIQTINHLTIKEISITDRYLLPEGKRVGETLGIALGTTVGDLEGVTVGKALGK